MCPVCGHTAPAKSKLDSHMLSHTGEKPFTCPTCPRSFNRKDNLKRHYLKCPALKAALGYCDAVSMESEEAVDAQ